MALLIERIVGISLYALISVLPIGDDVTMGYEDAAEVARMVNVQTVVGVHYDTFQFIKIDH